MLESNRDFLGRLSAARSACSVPVGLRTLSEAFARSAITFLFPHFAAERRQGLEHVQTELTELLDLLRTTLEGLPSEYDLQNHADAVVTGFSNALPTLHARLLDDAQAHYQGDPAARSVDEVILAYPGFLAIALYRVAHQLFELGVPLIPRLVTELGHRETGVVIGETAVIGNRVKLYQGVTLGAASVRKELANTKRHPTVGDDVVIYANATILGGDTVIGARSVVGGNVWLTRSIPPDSVVSHESVVGHRRPDADDALLEFHI
jgi:serine O-acetyltransferase